MSEDLLRILACPKCKAPVVREGEGLRCTDRGCGLLYPVRDGIPIMLIHEATKPESESQRRPA